jgi:hypothetical protein
MNFVKSIFNFYYTGFREMTTGRVLWLIIIIKLVIMFAVLRLIFFKPYLNRYDSSQEKSEYVSSELIERGNN